MPKHYVTFGHNHAHRIGQTTLDCDCVAVFEVGDDESGRYLAFELFDNKFCFEYSESEFNFDSLKFYPRGLVEVKR